MTLFLTRKLAIITEDGTKEGKIKDFIHWCSACKCRHIVSLQPNSGGHTWTWDGNTEQPTFNPSINIVGYCHYFVVGGKIIYCGDCSHELKGQSVDLPDFPESILEYNGFIEQKVKDVLKDTV